MNDVATTASVIPIWDHLPEMPWRNKIAYLTYKFLQLPQVECPVEHIYEPGLYIREMKIPAGTFFLGRVHRHGHKVELISGEVIHILPDGTRRHIAEPTIVHTVPGYQMVAFIVTDVLCRSVHPNPTESRDQQALEDDYFESVESLKQYGKLVSQQMEHLWLA